MKNFNSDAYLNILMVATFAILLVSVAFTLATGKSPLEALGVSPAAGTIGTIVLVASLILLPRLFRKTE